MKNNTAYRIISIFEEYDNIPSMDEIATAISTVVKSNTTTQSEYENAMNSDSVKWIMFHVSSFFHAKSHTVTKNTGHVYLFCDSSGCYKIGMSKDVKKRVRQLKNGNHSIRIVDSSDILENAEKAEKALHDMFTEKRIGDTEWFKLSADDVIQIKRIFDRTKGKSPVFYPSVLDEVFDRFKIGLV